MMKNMAILALILASIGSVVHAESAVSEAPLTLAHNSSSATGWLDSNTIDNDTLGNKIELETAKTMEAISIALSKQLENKIAKELEYVMH